LTTIPPRPGRRYDGGMYIIEAVSPNDAVGIELEPLPVQDALKRAINMRDDGFCNITLRHADTGVVVDVDQFMRHPPRA